MVRKPLVLAGIISALLSCFLLLEGNFGLSTIMAKDIHYYAPQGAEFICMEESPEGDTIVSLSRYESEYRIQEFSKNTLWDRYELSESHTWQDTGEPFYSVVSSALLDHAYCVDFSKESITVYGGQHNADHIRLCVLLLLFGTVLILCPRWLDRRQ